MVPLQASRMVVAVAVGVLLEIPGPLPTAVTLEMVVLERRVTASERPPRIMQVVVVVIRHLVMKVRCLLVV